jgi:hypothetical protein
MTTNFYFIGGEDHDFSKIGSCTVNTATTAGRRTAYARCALQVAAASLTDGWVGSFSSAQSSFWLAARMYLSNNNNSTANVETIAFTDSAGARRLVIRTGTGTNPFALVKRNASNTNTALVTLSVSPSVSLVRWDIQVNYGTSGSINIYMDGALVGSYTGDVTTDSVTSLSGFVLGGTSTSATNALWSEVIVSDSDTRGLSLVTLTPSANGNAFTWDSGSYTSINETTLDDSSVMSSGTSGELAQFTVNSSGITGNPAIKAVAITARGAKGGTGPQNVKMNVRTSGIDYMSSAIALPAALNRVQGVFATNPGTSGPWAYTDLTATGFNIGIESEP